MDKKVTAGKQANVASKAEATTVSRKSAGQKKQRTKTETQNPFQLMNKQWCDSVESLAGFFPAGWLQPYQAFLSEWPAFNPSGLMIPQEWFSAWWGEPQQWATAAWPFAGQTPKVDLITRDKEYQIRAAIPGVRPEDVEVSFSDNTITLKGKTSRGKDEISGDYRMHETLQGSFSRSMNLPGPVATDKISTTLEDGMLEIVLPRAD